MSQALKGKVALIAGATRGAGRGIAVELGATGATVYATGRSTRHQRSEYNRSETIEETAELVQEVTLVLAAIFRTQQLPTAVALFDPRVVPGGDAVGAEFARGIEEILELDFAIAQHVRVGRAPGGIFGEEVREHAIPVLPREITEMDRQAEPPTDRDRIAAVVLGAAIAAAIIGPVLHEQSGRGFTGLHQQQGRHR